MKNIIEFLGNGQCECGGLITYHENESTTITVLPDGTPEDFNTDSYTIKGVCKKCGKVFTNIEKEGITFKPVNRLKQLVPTLQLVENLGLNPFGYDKGEK